MSSLLKDDALSGLSILITGASSGIGRATAIACAQAGARALILFARTAEKLKAVSNTITSTPGNKTTVVVDTVDIQNSASVSSAVQNALIASGRNGTIGITQIDILINNAGLALGAPARFPELKFEDIDKMVHTNLSGMLYMTHAVLNTASQQTESSSSSTIDKTITTPSMLTRGTGTILNITSTTALETPPFPGEAIYHTTKAAQEAFTNSLRTELSGTNIRVLALRPGVVAGTTFHKQRVGFEKDSYNDFMAGFQPLTPEDVAEQVVWVLVSTRPGRKERVSVKALDVVPSAQRMLYVIDKEWNGRNGVGDLTYDKDHDSA